MKVVRRRLRFSPEFIEVFRIACAEVFAQLPENILSDSGRNDCLEYAAGQVSMMLDEDSEEAERIRERIRLSQATAQKLVEIYQSRRGPCKKSSA